MTAPNIVNVTTITGKTSVQAIGTSATAIVSNAGSSNQVFKINALYIASLVGTNVTVTVDLFRSSTAYEIAFGLLVPPGATVDVLTKSIYLEEGDSLRLTASAGASLDGVCSYEVLS
jgi:hypothetical protein